MDRQPGSSFAVYSIIAVAIIAIPLIVQDL